nr:LytTR family DNA-binding domain-containing protein [Allomuricauda sp.]
MNYIIVDDEPLAHKVILSYAEQLEELNLVGQAHSAKEALSLLKDKKVDLIFLDIEMPKMKGIDLLATLKTKPMVILTTAYEQYALKGYELDVVDYLLKPFEISRFIKAVNKAYELWSKQSIKPSGETITKAESIFIKSDKTVHQIKLKDIQYLESDTGYVKIHLFNSKSILSNLTLQDLEEKLPDEFIRIHKSYIVPTTKIEKIEGNRITIEHTSLPIGRHYKKAINDYLENRS